MYFQKELPITIILIKQEPTLCWLFWMEKEKADAVKTDQVVLDKLIVVKPNYISCFVGKARARIGSGFIFLPIKKPQ